MSYMFQGQSAETEQPDGTFTGFFMVGPDGGVVFGQHSEVLEVDLGARTIPPVKLKYWTGAPGWDPTLVNKVPPANTNGLDQTQAKAARSQTNQRRKERTEMLKTANIKGYQPSPGPSLNPLPDNVPTIEAFPNGNESIYGNNFIQSQKFEDKDKGSIHAGMGVRSKFNAWSLFKFLNQPDVTDPKDVTNHGYNKAVVNSDIINPTAKRIIVDAMTKDSLSYNYSYSDFAATEHFGQISNDYLVTLRRFAYPVPDDIINTKDFKKGSSQAVDITQPDLARALTWMSPALGNDMKNVLAFGTKFNWKTEESQMQELSGGTAANKRGTLGARIDGSSLMSAVESGVNGYSADAAARKRARGDGYDAMSATYPNHVYGPLNVIKKVLVREQGLEFDQSFELNFYYDLKGGPTTSPKVMFMDVMANLLALTYNNAPFWGGGARWVGGSGSSSTGKPFGDYEKLKNGDYAGFAQSIVTGISTKFSAGAADLKAGVNGILSKGLNGIGDSKILDNVIGGGLMKLLGGGGAQGGQTAAAFLTGDPTGQWHLTIGNPMAPIMVCGNLALESSKIEFEGPLGYEGFPTKLKLTVTLKPARPRDKGEIESMFNAGKGRFYLTPDVPGARDLDDVVDVSQYGNKDKKLRSGMADRISDMSSG